MKHFIYLPLILITFATTTVNAQLNVTSVSGDFYENNDISLSWTVGELICETFSSDNYILTQGFQQPSLKTNAIQKTSASNVECSVFPNPAAEYCVINLSNINLNKTNDKFILQIIDLQGQLIEQICLESNSQQINLSQYQSGSYILKISNNINVQLINKLVITGNK